jgi:hypothetical protein
VYTKEDLGMPDNIKTSWIKELFAKFKKRSSKKRPLDNSVIESEIHKFILESGYTIERMNADMAAFQSDFMKYLEDKGFDIESYNDIELVPDDELKQELEDNDKDFKMPVIRSLSEKLNKNWEFRIFSDTTEISPGLVCYVVEKSEPTNKTPYVTYKPAPRVIVSVHNNGVNGGTVFITYEHKLSAKPDFHQHYNIVSEYEVIYSPLTKPHAEYICKLLNFQSKQAYNKAMLKIKKQKQK